MWRSLRHPNVLPLIGVMVSRNQFAMISDWMVNGNMSDFVKAHPDVNRITLVGLSPGSFHPHFIDNYEIFQLEGVAEGLIYVHDQGMIHGDLKGVCLCLSEPCFYSNDLDACQGEHIDRQNRCRAPGRLWFAYGHLRTHK